MPQEQATPEQDTPKSGARPEVGFAGELSRLLIGTTFELLGGVAHASSEAFHTANSHISTQSPNLVEGILKGNARFLEEMSHTMNTVAERLRAQHTAGTDQAAAGSPASPAPRDSSV
jgi:predicted trehalose synthase